MASAEPVAELPWQPDPKPWGRGDALALATWTAAIAAFFWDAVSLRRALFYFDVTEINYPYRDFLARELRAGRFSRWCPELYCGFPLFSESQAGYLHPLKYLLYPWLATWQAFNLDTVLSVWLTGLATYGWLRRHVGLSGALTGAAVFGLSGFVWAHLIHTSMTNALISVPLAFWALETCWDSGRLRGVVLGAVALACQVFAGHLQDTLLTGMAIVLYGLYRAAVERGLRRRAFAVGTAAGLVALGVLLAAVQWVPSKELLDRSPRAGGLTWNDLTYGSWHPELLPTLLVREAYGTRARDTDWMDGFYPYHEMNVYLGVGGLALALIGAAAYRDRWVGFWVLLAGVGGVLMLGRFTFLFDFMNRVPILGSSRIPVRYHLWVSLAVSALAAVGVDRLARPGRVQLRGAVGTIGVLALLCVPILIYVYTPVWTRPTRWTTPYHVNRYRYLGEELTWATARTTSLALATWALAAWAARSADPVRRRWLAGGISLLVIADLLGAHLRDVPTVAPTFWTNPPASAETIKADPALIRVVGVAQRSAGEPGYASERVDFFSVRDTLAWSLPAAWGLRSALGATPIIPRRQLTYTDNARYGEGRLDLEGVSHLVTGQPDRFRDLEAPEKVGAAYIHRNLRVLPRARLAGRPIYVSGEAEGARVLRSQGPTLRDRVVVEDPDRPLPTDATVAGRAEITLDEPERVEVATYAPMDSYLVLADTYDPGWRATLDSRPVPIRPAYVAFRAVYVPAGKHNLVFSYRPAGWAAGLSVSTAGLLLAALLLVLPIAGPRLGPTHGDSGWPRRWPVAMFAMALLVVLISAVELRGRGVLQPRWQGSFHQFTWGAGIEAMRTAPPRKD